MQKNNTKSLLKIAAILLVISSVTALLLATINYFTKDIIAENTYNERKSAIIELFPSSETFTTLDIDGLKLPVTEVWNVMDSNGGVSGYCIFVTVSGFKENIDIIVGTTVSGECLGIKIISQAETPGLGSKISDTDYLAQYVGEKSNIKFKIDIDAVAGATISSRAVYNGVEAALTLPIFTKSFETDAQITNEGGSEENGSNYESNGAGKAE